jgi:hypothetical protein
MPKRDHHLPPRVFAKGASYYLVRAEGKRRVWVRLSATRDGLPAMYAALAALLAGDVADDRMPAVCAAWQRDVMPRHAAKTHPLNPATARRSGPLHLTRGRVIHRLRPTMGARR